MADEYLLYFFIIAFKPTIPLLHKSKQLCCNMLRFAPTITVDEKIIAQTKVPSVSAV